jgi:copper chaperone
MDFGFDVENIKCDGCAQSIERAIRELPGVSCVAVDVAAGRVSVTSKADQRTPVRDVLARLGYPERGSVNGLGTRARSFVSGAVGRMSKGA